MTNVETAYQQLVNHSRETALLNSIESLLGWDERTMLPAGRRRLSGRTDDAAGRHGASAANRSAAGRMSGHAGGGQARSAQRPRRDGPRTEAPVRSPRETAAGAGRGTRADRRARPASLGPARAKNDFASFKPLLEKTFKLKREAAQAIGYKECAYDALLDEFEPGALTSQVTKVLSALREQLVPLVAEIGASKKKPDIEILGRDYPVDRQEMFAKEVAAKLGFDFNRGRLDVTAHPFCSRWARTIAASPRGTTEPFSRRVFRHAARSGPRHLRPGLAARAITACRRARRFRWAFTNRNRGCGKTWSAAAERSGNISTPTPSSISGASLGDVSLGRFYCGDERRAAVADPRRGRRSDVQLAHPDPLRAGAGLAQRAN